jgi:hypothetical protein
MSQELDVLLPFHKVDNYFVSAVNSVLESSNIKLNLFLIDDRLDPAVELPSFTSSSHLIHYMKTSGGVGYGAALRQGSISAQSEYLALMNSDDLVAKDRFSSQLRALQSAEISITGISRIRENNRASSSLAGNINSNFYHPFYLLFGAYGANATWAMSRSWWQRSFFSDADPALDWRIALDSFTRSEIHYSSEIKYFYRRHPNQHTAGKAVNEDFTSLFVKWTQLAKHYGLSDLDYSVFQFLALPWQRNQVIELPKLDESINQVLQVSKELPLIGNKQVESFIFRRLLLRAALGDNDYGTRLKLVLKSHQGVPSFLKDLIKY